MVRFGIHSLSRAARLHPRAVAAQRGIDIVRDVPYARAGHPAHTLDVYRPRAPSRWAIAHPRAGLRPAVLYVHGGGFRICSKDTHWALALAFARAGFVVFNVDYRLAPRHPFPAAIEDVCAAARFVHDAAARFGADAGRLVLAGESAGANLVASLAIATSYRRPEPFARAVFDAGVRARAVVAACGIFQVSDPERFARRRPMAPWLNDRILETACGYVRDVPPQHAGGLDLADPLVWLERGVSPDRPLPPFFLPIGTRDPLLDDSRRMRDALARLGAHCDARFYVGGIHAFHALLWREEARACWRDQFEFLAKHI
jgi:acetyl esterase